MSSGGSVSDYRGSTGAVNWIEGSGGELFIEMYNDTGAALTNGGVYIIDWTDDADSKGYYPTPGTAATEATAIIEVVVVNNLPLGKTTIADQAWGYFQYKGYCPAILIATGDMTDEQYMEVLDATTTATDDGATKTIGSFGIAKSAAVAAALGTGYLFGDRVAVAAA